MEITRRSLLGAALGLAAVGGLSACGGSRNGSSNSTAAGSTGTGASGGTGSIPAGSLIGVSLPWLGTQNWAEAQTMFKSQLEAAGYKATVQAADNKVANQQSQIQSMVQQGVKALVVGPIDGKQLGSVLTQAQQAGIKIIGYDRAIENTKAVDAVVQFGSLKTGEMQGQALLDGLKKLKGSGPYNIELFAGGPADPNATLFFKGAMSILQPKIDDKTLVVVSKQTSFTQCATPDWDNAKAQSRMDSLLSGNYSGKQIHGVLSPNDGIARAILTSCKQANQGVPVVTGLDAEDESVKLVWAGTQYCTVYKPTDKLVGKAIELIKSYTDTGALPTSGSEKSNNGVIDVPIFALEPVVVTKENEKEAFANDSHRLGLLK